MKLFALLVVVVACVAVQSTVTTTKNPNQILDTIVKEAQAIIVANGWDQNKKMQKTKTDIPVDVSGGGKTTMKLEITDGNIYGLNTLRRSKKAYLQKNINQLTGTFRLTNVRAVCIFKISTPAVGQAPASTVSGKKVTVQVDTLFMDVVINLNDDGTPKNISKYEVRKTNDRIISMDDLGGNKYTAMFKDDRRNALCNMVVHVINVNIKVKLNQAIQSLSTA